jgi:hypothetical protein
MLNHVANACLKWPSSHYDPAHGSAAAPSASLPDPYILKNKIKLINNISMAFFSLSVIE